MANYLKRPNGTEDVTPKNIHKWLTVEKVVRETAECFGFSEIRVPTFETTELFQRSVGETTDVVQKEMYSVTAKETVYTLRPEGTAGTIRAMLQNGMLAEALPQKVFYILSCFRHERPQAGRLREFHQFGIEMAGSASPYADADVIMVAKQILDTLGLKNISLHINMPCVPIFPIIPRRSAKPVRAECSAILCGSWTAKAPSARRSPQMHPKSQIFCARSAGSILPPSVVLWMP